MKPTILIGLGGIGSETVDNIYSYMTDEERKKTAVAILDTDVGDLQKRKHVKVKIQTSPAVKVENYVYNHQEVMEWFPYKYDRILKLMMSHGAGQIRAVSRLALYSALDEGRVYALDREIEKLSELNDSQYNESVNVIIVGSINGGTCSGSFLQMGLYMRRYFLERNPNISIFIQGVFLLPHAITKTGAIAESEWGNLESNAYAALKELNAMMSPSIVNKHTIHLEYRPGADSKITIVNQPYDNILFFDYENSKDQHLDRLSEYKLLLSETVYNAYISPIAEDYQSRFVNTILGFIKNNHESYYSASSVNKLIYPYEDIVEYLSLEWIIDDIGREWLKYDKDYDVARRSYTKSLDAGANPPQPQLSEIYIDNIDRLEHDTASPFEGMVFRQTRIIDKETSEVKATKDERYYEALIEHIENAIKQDKDFQKHMKRCTTKNSANFSKTQTALNEINRLESYRRKFEVNAKKIIQRHKNNLIYDIISRSCDRESGVEIDTKKKYNINHWIMPGEEAMHPVATRYFLYRLKQRIDSDLEKLKEEVKKAKEDVDSYRIKHDIPSSRDLPDAPYYETAQEVMEMIAKQTFFNKMHNYVTNNKSLQFDDFIDRFNIFYDEQISYISKLIHVQLKEYVLQDLVNQINIMIENWETLFENLGKNEGLLEDLKKRRNRILHKHEGGKKDIYVFASHESKKNLWKSVKKDLTKAVDRGKLYKQIGEEQYSLYCAKNSPERKSKIELNKKLYETLLIDAYKEALLDEQKKMLDVNLAEAVGLESSVNENGDTLSNYIERLENKNQPWMYISEKTPILTKFWGVSNKEVFGGNEPEGVTESEQFSDKEIVYLVMYHNLVVTDFAKFSVKGTFRGNKIEGPYFRAYQERMKNISKAPERYVTPHLDKRWDSELPDLNENVEVETQENQMKAFLLGVIEGNLYKAEHDGKEYFYVDNGTIPSIFKVNGEALEANRWLDLYRALSSHRTIIDKMIELHQKRTDEAYKITPWKADNDSFIKELKKGVVIKIIADILTHEVKDEASKNEVYIMLSVLGQIIDSYIKEGYGEQNSNTATRKIEEVKAKLIGRIETKKVNSGIIESIKRSLG